MVLSTFYHSKCVNPRFSYYKTKSDIAAGTGLTVKLRSQLLRQSSTIVFRSQWPSGLGRGSVADRLLGFAGSNSVCCRVEVSATSRSLVRRSPTDCGVSLCEICQPQE